MSDTDDLPPLPASDVVLYGDGYARETMQAYARAAIAHRQQAERDELLEQIAIERTFSDTYKARIVELEQVMQGWSSYAWRDGLYIGDVQEFLDKAMKEGIDAAMNSERADLSTPPAPAEPE